MQKREHFSSKICAVMLAAAVAAQPVYLAPALAADAPGGQTGSLSVDLRLELPTKGKTFTITLANGTEQSMTLNADGTQATYTSASIAPGSYQLTITADGYLPYTQQVTITAGIMTKLELHNSQQVNASLSENDRRFGVMAVGDVNGDGKIDTTDADHMMDAIDASSKDARYDLNGDGAVNAADLTYITLNYGANVTATPLSTLQPDHLDAKVGDDVTIKAGNLDDLTSGADTFVQFAPKNGAQISETNPVELSLDVKSADNADVPKVDGLVIAPPVGTENHITAAVFTVEGTDGSTYEAQLGGAAPVLASAGVRALAHPVTATQERDGTIVIDLGTQVAVKTVKIKITGASTNLVDIAQVEFVNGMENRIPEPELNIPTIQEVKQLSAGNSPSFSVSWDKQTNITGYEVAVSAGGRETITATTATTLTVTSLSGKLQTYTPYTVRVRATNGTWKSPYSNPQTITLKPESAPPAPEGVTVSGAAEAIEVSWKHMRDTQTYSVHYRAQGETEEQMVTGITGTRHTLTGLQPAVTYEVYVVGHNELGDSPKSEVKQAATLEAKPLSMPKYHLINTSNGIGQTTAHIEEVQLNAFQADSRFAITDGDMATYATADTWDTGGYNVGRAGPMITLDQEYEIDTVRFAARTGQGRYSFIRAYCWDAAGNESKVIDGQASDETRGSIQHKTDKNGNPYYELKFSKPQKVKRFQLCLANYSASGNNTISEISFYRYDSLADDIEALFTDETHSTLRDGVNEQTITQLQTRLDTPDAASGELHPDKSGLQLILNDARTLLEHAELGAAVQINNRVTSKQDNHLDFAYTMSDLQPLGKAVQAGETINVYVGAQGKDAGAATSLELVFTQNHGEASKWQQTVALKAGVNTITVPDIAGRTAESGGALYVRYKGAAGGEQYSVRVSGGADIPVLDVSGKDGQARTQAITAYVTKLEQHVGGLEAAHNAAGQDGTVHKDAYDPAGCILNYTDIVLDNMMYSVPASQVWAALNNAGAPAAKLETAIAAMEQQIDLFYQHKGLHKTATDKNRYPAQRLNIRYQKMFDGAFMYAGSQHIGIEFGSVGGLFGITPVTTDDKGNKTGGQLTGWGIAHEIGHIINSKAYAVAETTNNYYAILATGDTRSDYDKVHRAVTSGGAADEGTALAMYWQLHMAYDPYGNYKTFDTAEEQLKNLFFARVDSYARNPASAPQPKGTALTLSGSQSDQLIRLACAAAQKNLLPFFDAWGLPYNADTKAYAMQFPAETRKLQYLTPDAHTYRLSDRTGMAEGTAVHAALQYDSAGRNSNQITLTLDNTDKSDAMLGYEILRNGQAVAFVPADQTSYTDTITTGNNRVYQYEVIAYDKLLNATDPVKLDPVKVTHDGTLGRDKWTATTNMVSHDDQQIPADENNGFCMDTTVSAISRVIDGTGGYTGRVTGDKATHPEVVLKLGSTDQVTALRYKGDTADLTLSVSADGQDWETVRQVTADELNHGSAKLIVNSDGSKTIYFANPKAESNLYVREAAYVKVEWPAVDKDTSLTIDSLELLGPVGDNVEWLAQGQNSIGKLQKDYVYSGSNKIPAGSVVFTGTYKGNPAYNVVLLRDEAGKLIEGQQVILAPDPGESDLGDVARGSWIFWIEPNADGSLPTLPERVMAELYRVDDAQNLSGQRMVSDTLYAAVPETLPNIEFAGGQPGEAPEQPEEIPDGDQTHNSPETPGDGKSEAPDKDHNTTGSPDAAQDGSGDESTSGSDTEAGGNEMHHETGGEAGTPHDTDTQASETVLGPRMVLSARTTSVQTNTVRTVQVRADADGKPQFALTPVPGDAKRAELALQLGNQTAEAVIAMQTAFTVTDGVTGVKMDWSEAVQHRALLKECRYSAKTKTVTVYVTAHEDLLDAGVLTLGELSIQSARGTRQAILTLKPDSTLTVGTDYVGTAVADLESTPVQLDTDESGKPSGGGSSSGGSGGSSKPDKDKDADSDQTKPEQPGTDVSKVFGDIAPTAWYYNAVQRAYDKAWFQGTSATEFTPNGTMTRGMFVTVLGRFAGVAGTGTPGFADVPASSYYAGFVAWAAQNGIVNGVSATQFAPSTAVTREQMAVMVYGYLQSAGIAPAPVNARRVFADDTAISPWAREAVYAMQQAGVLAGMTDGTFQPKGTATRAEVATLLMNLESRIGR